MVRRALIVLGMMAALVGSMPAAAYACGGLIAGKHAEVLRSVTTLAAWHDGVEHYITGFRFAGAAENFGYIIPLPGIPTDIVKGGGWTLERLDREVFPVLQFRGLSLPAAAAAEDVMVVKHVKIDSLDIKVVKGGGADVYAWAQKNGFDMTKDAPKILESYKADIFALAKFDVKEAKGKFIEGQGVVIDFTIPLASPWIPLRILTLGKHATEPVQGHLYFLTDERPAIAPSSAKGMRIAHDAWATPALLNDLRSDEGTGWIPEKMWLTAIELDAPARTIDYDLTAAVGGRLPPGLPAAPNEGSWLWWLVVTALGVAAVGALRMGKAGPTPA